MKPEVAKRLRLLASAVSVLLALAILAGAWIYWRIRASLPQLDGTVTVAGLASETTIERDERGVPTIRGATRADLSRALGWLHAQDRFFQMDLMRRHAAGELAELVGKRALPRDRTMRMHGFRRVAQQSVTQLPPEQRAHLDAYTAGVNAGLAALREKPFEYILLRETPQPWRPEDSILVGLSMMVDLEDELGTHERTVMTLRDTLGHHALPFFHPLLTPHDAALDGTSAPLPPVPSPRVLDLRTSKPAEKTGHSFELGRRFAEREVPGSNAFALAGAHTAHGGALLANDIHLNLGIPNIWYRASLVHGDRTVTGITLPGTPVIVAGSNGHVAWGITASYADTGDIVVVEPSAGSDSWYVTPDKPDGIRLERREEVIRVKGDSDVSVDYSWTIWGPIVGTDERQRLLAYRWIAHDAKAIDLGLIDMEDAKNVTAALGVAQRVGVPAVNVLVADRDGDIGWTVAGRLPKRAGYDGRLPVSWSYGDRSWAGYHAPGELPQVSTKADAAGTLPAPDGRLWSGNQRMLGGEGLAKLGDGGYPRPARAAQIRDLLGQVKAATPRDLLAIQLDHRALFLEPWHKILMETLTPPVTAERKPRAALRSFAEKWEGRASTDAISYRIVRDFRIAVYALVYGPIFESCLQSNPQFNATTLQLEPALRAMLQEKPAHLLNPKFTSWDALLVQAVDDVIQQIDKRGVSPAKATWGWANTVRVRHPFSGSFPWLKNWLDMPPIGMAGDTDMPLAQGPVQGVSERMIVAPGREAEGIFHMPGGQSGHPMSPFYRAGHEAWARAEPSPFLPGKPRHTLTLRP